MQISIIPTFKVSSGVELYRSHSFLKSVASDLRIENSKGVVVKRRGKGRGGEILEGENFFYIPLSFSNYCRIYRSFPFFDSTRFRLNSVTDSSRELETETRRWREMSCYEFVSRRRRVFVASSVDESIILFGGSGMRNQKHERTDWKFKFSVAKYMVQNLKMCWIFINNFRSLKI